MMEFVIGVFMAVAVIEITTDVAGKAYDYVEPKVTEAVEYVQDKINPEEQE
jgi:Tfp pilus assembly major pilin PilA